MSTATTDDSFKRVFKKKMSTSSKAEELLCMVSRGLSKNAFLNREKKGFSSDEEMWCWIHSLDCRTIREIAIVSDTEMLRRMSRERHQIYVMLKDGDTFRTRSYDSLGWSREETRMSTVDVACIWNFEETFPMILYEEILQDTKRLRFILESDMKDIVEIEIILMEESQHKKIENESHLRSNELRKSSIATNQKFEAMTCEAFLARILLNKFKDAFLKKKKITPTRETQIARAYEERISGLTDLWRKLSQSHVQELKIHETLVVSNAPRRLQEFTKHQQHNQQHKMIIEMILTIPVFHYSSTNTSAMKRWKGRLHWLSCREQEILIEEEKKEETEEPAKISKKTERRRKKKNRMKEKYRKKKMLSIVSIVVDEIVQNSVEICLRNERRRRKRALHEKQQIILRQKQRYVEMRSISLCMIRAAVRISERRASKVACAKAAYISKHASDAALTRADSVYRSVLTLLQEKKMMSLSLKVQTKGNVLLEEDELVEEKLDDDEESSKTTIKYEKKKMKNTEKVPLMWASGRCNSLYEWNRDRKGLRAVGSIRRSMRNEEEDETNSSSQYFSVSSKTFRKSNGRTTSPTIRNRRSRRNNNNSSNSNTSDPLSDITWYLHRDILDITAAFDRIAKQRRPFQLAVVNAVRAVVNRLWPAARVEVFGSFGQGLSIPASDVDLVVCDVHEHIEQVLLKSDRQASCVQVLAELLREQDWVRNVQTLETAKIPIIKAKTFFEELGAGGVALDISFDMPAHRGLATCAFVRNLRATYPALVPLTLILKQFLVAKGLNDPYTGGLSSYGTLLMVAAVLDESEQMIFSSSNSSSSNTIQRPMNLGALLIIFLRLYAERFDPSKHGISLRRAMSNKRSLLKMTQTTGAGQREEEQEENELKQTQTPLGRCFFSRHRLWQTQMVEQQMQQYRNHRTAPFSRDSREWFRNLDANSLLVIKDPYNPNNNVGRSCFGIYQVRAEWQRALSAINNFAKNMKLSDNPDMFQKEFSALGAFFSTDHHRRVVQLAEQLYKPSGVPASSPHIHSQFSASSPRNSMSFEEKEKNEEVMKEDFFEDEEGEKTNEEEVLKERIGKEAEDGEEKEKEEVAVEEILQHKEFKIMKRVSEMIEDSPDIMPIDITAWNKDDSKFRQVLLKAIVRHREADGSNADLLIPPIEDEELKMYRVLSLCNEHEMRVRFIRVVLLDHACVGYGKHEILLQMLETLSLICHRIDQNDERGYWVWKYMTQETVVLVNRKFELATREDKKDVKLKTRTQLKILGRWLGLVTLGRNRPLLTSTMNLKSLLMLSQNSYFLPAVPFVCKVITAAAESIVFRIPNPWTVAILTVLQQIYHDSATPLSLKFEIEVLFHQMQSDINSFDSDSYPPFRWNQFRSVDVQNNEDDDDESMVRRIVNRVSGNSTKSPTITKSSPTSTHLGWNERVQRWAVACWKQLSLMQQGTPAFPQGCAGCGVGHHTAHTPNCPISTLILSFPSDPSV